MSVLITHGANIEHRDKKGESQRRHLTLYFSTITDLEASTISKIKVLVQVLKSMAGVLFEMAVFYEGLFGVLYFHHLRHSVCNLSFHYHQTCALPSLFFREDSVNKGYFACNTCISNVINAMFVPFVLP